MQTEKEKMLAGALYDARDATLVAERARAVRLCRRLDAIDPADVDARRAVLAELFGADTDADIQPPFHCDYGRNVVLGRDVYVNVRCVFLDVAPIRIGDGVLIGPGVQLCAATHPLDEATRSRGLESGAPISIGDRAWIGAGAIVLPGVGVGPGSVIGAGSVVARSIPAGVLAVGNPCRVVRPLASGDAPHPDRRPAN